MQSKWLLSLINLYFFFLSLLAGEDKNLSNQLARVHETLDYREFLESDFEKICSERPDKLPTELLRLACQRTRGLMQKALSDLQKHGKITEKTLKGNSGTFGWGPNLIENLNDRRTIESLLTPIIEDTVAILNLLAVESLMPDIVKFGQIHNITSKHCYDRHLDVRSLGSLRNWCTRVRRTRIGGIPYRWDFAPPVAYKLPVFKLEAPVSLLHSRFFPGWILAIDQNIAKIFGQKYYESYLDFKDFQLANFLATRISSDLGIFELQKTGLIPNGDDLEALRLQLDYRSLQASKNLASQAKNKQKKEETPWHEDPVFQTVSLIKNLRSNLEREYGKYSPMSDPFLHGYSFVLERHRTGVMQYMLGTPLSKRLIQRLSEETRIINMIPYISVDLAGLASLPLVVPQIPMMIAQIQNAMQAANYLQYANQIAEILKNPNLNPDEAIRVLLESGNVRDLFNSFRFDINKLRDLGRNFNSFRMPNLDLGLGGVGIRIHRTHTRFCDPDILPTSNFTPPKKRVDPRDSDILKFFDASNPLDFVKRLSVLTYSTGFPDSSVISPDFDYLKFLKPYENSLPIGGLFARLSPETLSVLNSLPEFTKKYLNFAFALKSPFLVRKPDECVKALIQDVSTGETYSNTSRNRMEQNLKCAFGDRVFKHYKMRATPFSTEAQRLEILQTLAESYFLAPHFWTGYTSYRSRLNNLYTEKYEPKKASDLDSYFRTKSVLMPTDKILTTHPRAPIFNSCVTGKEFVEKDFDDIAREGVGNPLFDDPQDPPQTFLLWTFKRCCLYGRGPNEN